MHLHKRIINELGNTIDITVSRSAGSVTLDMIGPTSRCENIVTLAEAHTLNDLLTSLLSERPPTP